MGTLIGWFVAKGFSERVARPLAHLLAFAVIIALLAALAGLWMHFHDKGVVADERTRVDALGSKGREQAAEEAAIESAALAEQEKRSNDAILNAGDDGPPSPAALALGCDQLRRAGIATPPECGPGGGDGGQAGPHR